MADNTATILIPDISGFTEFMTTTELSHSSHAINILIDTIINAAGDEYQVSEIEGDSVLFIRKGPPTSIKEIQSICLKIFNAFHFQRKWLQQYTICPCGACQAIINLSLKFIAHHGPLAEIRVGGFVKQSGTEMIVAHRLLKNSIDNHEYLLMTERLLEQADDSPDSIDMEWKTSSEEYASIGKVNYRFALLNDARKKVPDPPVSQNYYRTDNSSFLELPIAANYFSVYMMVMNIPDRAKWLPGIKTVEQELPYSFVGSIHHFTFENYKAIVSPIRMVINDEGIMYAESWKITEMDLSVVFEMVFKKSNENTCGISARFLNAGDLPIIDDARNLLFELLQQMTESLKTYCESNPL
ncbi:MAG: DUF2652 domain-containing protein [Ferruginibacter sp.]